MYFFSIKILNLFDLLQISCQLRLSNQMSHLSTMLNASVGGNEGANAFYNRLNSRFSVCLDEERKGVDRAVRSVALRLKTSLSVLLVKARTHYLEILGSNPPRRRLIPLDQKCVAKTDNWMFQHTPKKKIFFLWMEMFIIEIIFLEIYTKSMKRLDMI